MGGWVLIAGLVLGAGFEPLSEETVAKVKTWVEAMKESERGPYRGVAWFCHDGSILPPKSYACVDKGGGLQYGILTPEADRMKRMGITVGTVLASLKPEDLTNNNYEHARSLIIERYLERALDGWVLKTARKKYRGYRQTENETEATYLLMTEIFQDEKLLNEERALIFALMQTMPVEGGGELAGKIRGLASTIGDADPSFETARFKIHALPEPSDIKLVERYIETHPKEENLAAAKELKESMATFYDPKHNVALLESATENLLNRNLKAHVNDLLAEDLSVTERIARAAKTIALAGALITSSHKPSFPHTNFARMRVLRTINEMGLSWAAPLAKASLSRDRAMRLAKDMMTAFVAMGLLTQREADQARFEETRNALLQPKEYIKRVAAGVRVLEWIRAKIVTLLGTSLPKFEAIEPQARMVVDDMMRSGFVLSFAVLLDRLNADAQRVRGGGHRVVGLKLPTTGLRGENPGLAVGALRVVTSQTPMSDIGREEIVLLRDLPPDLPPVAGILTVGAAGSLSHVSLLARNLAIPNAAVGGEIAHALEKRAGERVVVGVSQQRRVVVGFLNDFRETDRAQLVKQRKSIDKPFLTIDADRLALDERDVRMLDEVGPKDSGRTVGPKAAELGRLRKLFPKRVSNAAVIPFGAFVAHVDRPGPNGEPSPLAKLRTAYAQVKGKSAEVAETQILQDLEAFRAAIDELPFEPAFEKQVWQALRELGKPGRYGVFVRSDTNVEDLKQFTGAGLNKTVLNRVSPKEIFAAIRAVWASPYTERSFRWRQRLLKNPEHVFPSVILHKTVPAKISGVMVTTDVERGGEGLTISAAEGVAGVVDGGVPETVVIQPNGDVRLLSSSRTITRKAIPRIPGQGIIIEPSRGYDPLLSKPALADLQNLVHEVKTKIPPPEDGVPWDIEFGFHNNRAYLMQIRPLRLSEMASTHPFLKALDARASMPTWWVHPGYALP